MAKTHESSHAFETTLKSFHAGSGKSSKGKFYSLPALAKQLRSRVRVLHDHTTLVF